MVTSSWTKDDAKVHTDLTEMRWLCGAFTDLCLGSEIFQPLSFQLEALWWDNTGGRKLNVCECVLHVSWLWLTASLPCVKFFPGVVWSASGLLYWSLSALHWNISSLLLKPYLGSFCICAFEMLGGLFHPLTVSWVCQQGASVFCRLASLSPVWNQWCVLLTLANLWWHH